MFAFFRYLCPVALLIPLGMTLASAPAAAHNLIDNFVHSTVAEPMQAIPEYRAMMEAQGHGKPQPWIDCTPGQSLGGLPKCE